MRNSNKVLLIAAAAMLVFVVAFVLVMGLTMKGLLERRGRTAQSSFSTRPVEERLLPCRGFEDHRSVVL